MNWLIDIVIGACVVYYLFTLTVVTFVICVQMIVDEEVKSDMLEAIAIQGKALTFCELVMQIATSPVCLILHLMTRKGGDE